MYLHRFQALRGGLLGRRGKEETMALMIATSHTAAELMQLRKAEAFRSFDADDRGIGHIDPHFNNGGRNEDVELSVFEGTHDRFLFRRDKFAMQRSDSAAREFITEPLFLAFHRPHFLHAFSRRCGNEGADDKDLPSFSDLVIDETLYRDAVFRSHDFGLDDFSVAGFFQKHGEIVVAVRREREGSA